MITAGKYWKLNCKLISKMEYDDKTYLATFNINNGAIIVCQCLGKYILRAWYDAANGPKVTNWDKLYIWNSKEVNTKGNKKMDFTIHKSDLEAML